MQYIYFYLVFTAFYSTIHGYVFLNIYRWTGGGKALLFLALWTLFMLPVWFIRIEFKPEWLSKLYFTVGFSWFGFAFILFCSFFALDILRFLAWILVQTKFFGADFARELATFLKAGRLVPFGIFFAAVLSVYGLWNAQNPKLYKLSIYSDKISPDSSLRLAVASDIHLSSLIGAKQLKKVVDMVNGAKVDLFISLGDLVDADMSKKEEEIKLFNEINTSYGKIAVLGNHEFYADYENSLNFHEKAGLKLLRAQGINIKGIYFAGIDDPMARTLGLKSHRAGDLLRNNYKEEAYTVLLSHRPEILEEHLGFFDLQLSGHTHGGQIWPAGFIFRKISHKSPQHLSRAQDQLGLDKSRSLLENNLLIYYVNDVNYPNYTNYIRGVGSPELDTSAFDGSSGLDISVFDGSSGQGQNDFNLREKVADSLENTLLFITNGVGFWGPPMRIGAAPEVLIIDLLPKISQSSESP